MSGPGSVLVVATKAPWPPVDGGRVVLGHTLAGLATDGRRVVLVAPVAAAERDLVARELVPLCEPRLVAAAPRGLLRSLVAGLLRRQPLTIQRHRLRAVEREVAAAIRSTRFDVVLCEQVQALGSAAAAVAAGVPVVVRAHNVESRLWRYMAERASFPRSAAFAAEARRLAAWERRNLGVATAVAAIAPIDRDALAVAAGAARVEVVPAPFPATLPAAPGPLPGRPAAVVLSSDWPPAREAVRALALEWWPKVRARLPEARLHVYGPARGGGAGAGDGVEWRDAPVDSRDAFPEGAVLVVPPRHPTGVPVKALEAWARGVPVVADEVTAAALEARDGRELLVVPDGDGLAAALESLAGSPELAGRLAAAARERLEARHDPVAVSRRLVELGAGGAPAGVAGRAS